MAQNVSISDFLVQLRKQRIKIDPCAKFQPDWKKDKESQISTWNDAKNCLMTSYLPPNDDVSKLFMAFGGFCHVKFGGDWTTKEKQREA